MDSLFFCNFFHLTVLFFFFCFLSISTQEPLQPNLQKTQSLSLSFPLRSLPLARHRLSLSSPATRDSKISIKAPFKYTQGLVLSLPIGTPPQTQQMVLDTGSQLSWVQCRIQNRSSAFDPSLSSSFSLLPCNTSLCKPPIPDFTLPTDCGPDRACHYSYFYADGTLAEGNLVREKIALSNSQTTPPVILGCARDAQPAEGILGMNLGRLSFASQAKIPKFSYCAPPRRGRREKPAGSFYIGENPNLAGSGIRYLNLLRFDRRGGGTPPYLDVAAYTVGMEGVRVGLTRVNVSRSAFRPDAGGAGQTMVDSGTEYTYLVEAAYAKVKEEVARRLGKQLKSGEGFIYGGGLDTCYVGRPAAVGRLVGDLGLVFEGGVELVVEAGRAWVGAGSGSELACLSIGSSQLLGMESNIIGNYHQQNYWVEFDLLNSRVGFGKAHCTAAV